MSEDPQGAVFEAQQHMENVTGVPLRIEFFKPGIKPPVFVSGSFTSWTPVEMVPEPSPANPEKPEDAHFYQDFPNVPEGEQQYKFKLGLGDWWTTDDNVPTTTDDHGNKNNVVVVKNNLNVIIQSPPAVPPSKAAEKEIDRPSTEKAQTTAMQERSPTQSTQDVSKQADNPSNTKGFEGNTKSQSSLSPSIPPSDLVSIDATSTKQTANTAAEVADSAAKLDQTPPKTSLDTSAPHEDAAKKEAASGAADQAVATTIAAKAVNQSTAEVKSPQVNLADTIVSPHVPPAPAATPVAISPSLLATKATSPDSVPPLPSPDEPLKGLDPAASAIDAKLGPSEQEIDVAAPRLPPSSVAPPTQRDSKLKPSKQELAVAAPVSSEISNTTLQRFGLQGREPAASFAPQVPLPPSPKPSTRASSVEASEAPQTGEFPEDDPKLVKRQTTFRERGTAVVQTLMTIPNMVAAFFLGIMSAFTDWLDTTFNPQRRTRGSEDGKTAKQD